MTEAKVYSSADNIQVMKADGGYTTYFRWNGQVGFTAPDPTKRAWALMGKTEAAKTNLSAGASMWYQSRTAEYENPETYYTITVAGAVSLAEDFEYTLNKEYTLVGNPFPVEIPLNGGVVLTEPTRAKVYSSADNVQIMKPDGGYTTYFAWNGQVGFAAPDPTQEGWSLMGETKKTTANFPIARGAWFQCRNPSSTAKLRFVNPVAK